MRWDSVFLSRIYHHVIDLIILSSLRRLTHSSRALSTQARVRADGQQQSSSSSAAPQPPPPKHTHISQLELSSKSFRPAFVSADWESIDELVA